MKVKTIVLGLFGALALAGCNGTAAASAASSPLKSVTLTQANYTNYVQVSNEAYGTTYYSIVFYGSPNLRYDDVTFGLTNTRDSTYTKEIKLTVFGSGRYDRIYSDDFTITLKRGSVTEIFSGALS